MKPKTDPIVEAIRAYREAHAEKFNFDLPAICRDLRRQEAESGRSVVSLPARRTRIDDTMKQVPDEGTQELKLSRTRFEAALDAVPDTAPDEADQLS